MSSNDFTTQGLRDYIRRKLGHPSVQVELLDPQLDDCVDDALGKFNHYLCVVDPRVMKNVSGSIVIPLLSGDRGVVGCKTLFPQDDRTYAQMSIFELVYRMVFPRMPVSEWYMLKSFYETYQRIRGTDPDWYVDGATNTLYVDCSSGPYDIAYFVATDLTLERIARLQSAMQRDFKEYALALAKKVLGYVRGKFAGTIPVPGGTMTTDAEQLKTEADTKIKEIEERLEKIARFSVSPVIWA